jgi:LemA protein
MRKWIPLAVIGGIVLIVGLFLIGRYNSMVSLSTEVDGSWAQVENQLQRRNDLIPNLVATVKGYAAHEKEIFTQVAEARAKMAGAKTPAEAGQANGELSSALSRLLVVAENYPQLKSDANFRDLQAQLEGTENRINASRRDYNEAVQAYNTRIRTFPDAIGARIFYGAKPKVPFEAAAAAQQAPSVNFNTN